MTIELDLGQAHMWYEFHLQTHHLPMDIMETKYSLPAQCTEGYGDHLHFWHLQMVAQQMVCTLALKILMATKEYGFHCKCPTVLSSTESPMLPMHILQDVLMQAYPKNTESMGETTTLVHGHCCLKISMLHIQHALTHLCQINALNLQTDCMTVSALQTFRHSIL